MNTPYLTLAEASSRTGRSLSTIRRLIHSIARDNTHPERDAVIPSPAEAAALKKKGENFTWRIREDIVDREFGSAPTKKEKVTSGVPSDVLTVLERELTMKNQQIEKQWEVITALNERLREGNILMASLQKRLALPEPASTSPSTMEASTVEPSMKSSKKSSTKTPEKAAAEVAAKKAKKKLFSWLWQPIGVSKK